MNKQETNQNPRTTIIPSTGGVEPRTKLVLGDGVGNYQGGQSIRRERARIWIAAICLILAIGLLAGCGKKGASQAEQRAVNNPQATVPSEEVINPLDITANYEEVVYYKPDKKQAKASCFVGPRTWTHPSLNVTLPDGLYMSANYDSTMLFIAENGKLLDPYQLLDTMGEQEFSKKYLLNKRFVLCVGNEVYKEVTIDQPVVFNKRAELGIEAVRQVYRDIRVNFKKNTFYQTADGARIAQESILSAIIAPEGYKARGELKYYKPTQEEADKLLEECKETMLEEYILSVKLRNPAAYADHKDKLQDKPYFQIHELNGMDVNGNGIIDYVGGHSIWVFSKMDKNKPQYITSPLAKHNPSFTVGIIDINDDNKYELIIRSNTALQMKDKSIVGAYIYRIWNYSDNAWQQMFYVIEALK